MLKQAVMGLVTEIVMALGKDIYHALKGAKDEAQALAKLRGVLKANLHEQVHNAIVRATR